MSESNQPGTVLLRLSRSRDTERGWAEGRKSESSLNLRHCHGGRRPTQTEMMAFGDQGGLGA